MVSKILSPAGRYITYMGKTHKKYIKEGLMTLPNEYRAVRSLLSNEIILFRKKRTRKYKKVNKGYEEEEIVNPDTIVQPNQTYRNRQVEDSQEKKLSKETLRKIRNGFYYTNKPQFKPVFKNERKILKNEYNFNENNPLMRVINKNVLLISNIIFNTYLNNKSQVGKKIAIYSIKAVFIYGEDDNDLRSFVVNGEIIKFQDIYNEVKKLIPQTDGQHVILSTIKTNLVERPTSFGCNEGKTHKLVKYLGKNKVVLYSPKSTNNNCAIMCFMYGLNIKGNQIKPSKVRKKCGLTLGTLITHKQTKLICQYFNDEGFDCGYIIYDENFKPIDCYNCKETDAFYEGVNIKKIIHLYSCAEHCYYIETIEKECEKCYKKYIFTHHCNDSRVSFLKHKYHQNDNRFVIIKNIKQKNELDYDKKLFFFDLETFKGDNIKAVPYAVGWHTDGIYKQLYGKDSFHIFMNELEKVQGKVMTAYNGSRFDFYFLMEELIKRGAKITKQVFRASKLMSFKFAFGDNKPNKMFDLCLFTLCPLKKACNSFKTKFNKSEFDHTKIKCWDDVDRLRSEVEPYLELDVMSFREVFIKFNQMIYELESVNITKFITLSNMAYELNTLNIKHDIELFNDYEKYQWTQRSMYGGRVHPLKRYSEIKNYSKVISGEISYEQLKESNDFIYNADATSLYPAGMKGVDLPIFWKWDRINNKAFVSPNFDTYYPIGLSEWSEDGESEFKKGYLGCYYIEFEAPKNIRFPYLLRKNINRGVVHSLEDGEGVYTCADIEGALICGYTIKKWGRCLYWKEKACKGIFDEFVEKYFNLKMIATKENNPVKRQIAKILLNSLFGKFLQQPVHDKTVICNNYKEVCLFMSDNNIKDFDVLEEKLLLKGVSKEELKIPEITKPSQLGVFILSYSKRIMLTYLKEIDPTLEGDIFSYSDTDSLHISGEAYKKLLAKGLINEGEEDKLGMLTNDIDDDSIIIREINISPKCYYYEYIDKYGRLHINDDGELKCKGIAKEYLNSELYENEVNETFGSLFSEKEITFTSIKKIGTTLTKKNKKDGLGYFNITEQTQTRTFSKTSWGGMILKGEMYYPFGYNFGLK